MMVLRLLLRMGRIFSIFGKCQVAASSTGFAASASATPPATSPPSSSSTEPRPIQIFFANINMWSRKAGDFLLGQGFTDSVGCFVEHHLDATSIESVKKKFHEVGRDFFGSAAVPTGRSATGTSAGAAICPAKSLCMRDLDDHLCRLILGADGFVGCRWQAAVLRVKGASILIVTTYLVHTIGLTGDNIVLLEQLLVLIRSLGLPTIICGDWQMAPTELVASEWPRRAGLVLALPPHCEATCNLGTEKASYLDYFLVSPQLAPLLFITPIYTTPWKTHISLRLTLHSRPQSFLVPTLRIPKQLPRLPVLDDRHVFVPETWNRAVLLADEFIAARAPDTGIMGLEGRHLAGLPHAQRKISSDYARASTQAEIYTCLTAGVSEDALQPYIGRGHFPSVRLRKPFGNSFGNSTFACSRCDTWARMESALSLLSRFAVINFHTLNSTVVAIKNMAANVDKFWSPLKKHNCPKHIWVNWISELSSSAVREGSTGYTKERLETWLARASAQKEKAVYDRVKHSRNSFKDWLRSALDKGAAAAHALVREKVPSAAVSMFSLDNIFSSWGSLWHDTFVGDATGNPRVLVAGHVSWKSQRDSILEALVSAAEHDGKYFSEQGDFIPTTEILDFGVEEFEHAVASYPARKKPGVDLWTTAELKQFPREIILHFSRVLTSVQRATAWPIQNLLCLGSLIAKALGGQRPISKTPLLYRLWCVVRAPTLQSWKDANCPPWDTASKGHCAEVSACSRLWLMEAAHVAGLHAAGNMWDMEKFFDTVNLDDVRRLGVQRHYPRTELQLALAMHRAPRILQMLGVAANVIVPTRSIIQGCTHSDSFARLIMWRPVQRSVQDVDDIRVTDRQIAHVIPATYVDDVSQIAVGTRSGVARALTIAGISFTSSIRQFKLLVSCKSLVVSSDLQLAKLISSTLRKEARVTLTPCTSGRDLGILLSAKAKRNTSLQSNRLNKAVGRLKRIAPLAKSLRAARRLIATGALPQCLWGSSSIGLAPSSVKRLRTAAAGACGIGGRGRCATTALAISLGPHKDPLVLAMCRQVSIWIDVWRSDSRIRALTARHWAAIVARVIHPVSGDVIWPSVCSTLSATIALLHQNGWTLQSPVRWSDPSGKVWLADFDAPKSGFLDIVREHTLVKIWMEASRFEHGLGLHKGVHWQSTLKLHRRLTGKISLDNLDDEYDALEGQQNEQWPPAAASWLELFLTAGYWTNGRVNRAQPSAIASCPRCGFHTEDAEHLIWTCPRNRDIIDPKVADTQCLVQQAREGIASHPCLWLRGLLPLDLLHINKPFPDTSQLILIHRYLLPGTWPSGSYHSDASGGPHNSFPLIRRCGFGVVLMQPHFSVDLLEAATCASQVIVFGAFGALPGAKQTVPRAELFAIFEIIVNLTTSAVATITTDSKVNVDVLKKGRRHAMDAENGDIWADIFTIMDQRQLAVDIRWSKGHPTVELAQRYAIRPEAAVGNIFSDALAERAAKTHAVFTDDSFGALWHFELVAKIQKRAVVILSLLAGRQTDAFKENSRSGSRPLLLPVSGHVLQSEHRFAAFGRTLHCYVCHNRSPPGLDATRAWLGTPCRPNRVLASSYNAGAVRPTRLPHGQPLYIGNGQIHESHVIMVHRGLYFCRKCASWAAKKLQNLSTQCEPTGKKPGDADRIRKLVVSLLQGKLPRGLKSFPNDTAAVVHLLDSG